MDFRFSYDIAALLFLASTSLHGNILLSWCYDVSDEVVGMFDGKERSLHPSPEHTTEERLALDIDMSPSTAHRKC